jgi:hypothetical protein
MGLFPALSEFWPDAMDVTSFPESAVPAGKISPSVSPVGRGHELA